MSAHHDHPRDVLAVVQVGRADGEVHVEWMWCGDAHSAAAACRRTDDEHLEKYPALRLAWTSTPQPLHGGWKLNKERPPPGRRWQGGESAPLADWKVHPRIRGRPLKGFSCSRLRERFRMLSRAASFLFYWCSSASCRGQSDPLGGPNVKSIHWFPLKCFPVLNCCKWLSGL